METRRLGVSSFLTQIQENKPSYNHWGPGQSQERPLEIALVTGTLLGPVEVSRVTKLVLYLWDVSPSAHS